MRTFNRKKGNTLNFELFLFKHHFSQEKIQKFNIFFILIIYCHISYYSYIDSLVHPRLQHSAILSIPQWSAPSRFGKAAL